jgi:catechol 2,3-dioxygenase-like lactoylglutathione lyase family enzyme
MNAAMRITTADHVNLHVRDPEATLAFYQGVLGLQPERLDDFRAAKRPLFAFRVSEDFIIHVFPDAAYDRQPRGYDHLALVVEGASPQELIAYLQERGVAVEREFENLWGARGDGWACYLRDPDGYRVELKIY